MSEYADDATERDLFEWFDELDRRSAGSIPEPLQTKRAPATDDELARVRAGLHRAINEDDGL